MIEVQSKSATDIFLDLIVAFLTPMFLVVANGDIAFARAAAIETIEAYRAQTRVDPLAVAQVIAFGLAALGSLSLAMAEGLSIQMVLRLRGIAVSSHRAGKQSRRVLQEYHPEAGANPNGATLIAEVEATRTKEAEPQVRAVPAQPAPQPQPAPPHPNPWAAPMADIAAELASLPNLPPAQRRAASIKAAALSSVARDLFAGKPYQSPPFFKFRHQPPGS